MPGRPDPAAAAGPDPQTMGHARDDDGAAAWDWTYDPRNRAAAAWIFRRSGEVAAGLMARSGVTGGVWLDIGCGTGRITERLTGPGRSMIGADRDHAMLRRAAARAGAAADAPGPRYLRADAASLPLADSSIDGVVATSFMGATSSPEAFLSEARRVLRPGGILIVTATRRGTPLLRLNHLVSATPATTGVRKDYRLYSGSEFQRLLRDAGFSPTTRVQYNAALHLGTVLLPPRFLARALDRLAGTVAPFLARNIAILARRVDPARSDDRRTSSGPATGLINEIGHDGPVRTPVTLPRSTQARAMSRSTGGVLP